MSILPRDNNVNVPYSNSNTQRDIFTIFGDDYSNSSEGYFEQNNGRIKYKNKKRNTGGFWSDFLSIGTSIVTGLVSLISGNFDGFLSSLGSIGSQLSNREREEQTFDAQQELNEIEHNAQVDENEWYHNTVENGVSIKANDLVNSGFSKTLAAGSTVSASPTRVASPNNSFSYVSAGNVVADLLSSIADLGLSESQSNLINAQAEGQAISNAHAEEGYILDENNKRLENERLELENELTRVMNPLKVDEKLREIEKLSAEVSLTLMQEELTKEQVEKLIVDTYVSKAELLNLDKDLQIKVLQYEKLQLENKVLQFKTKTMKRDRIYGFIGATFDRLLNLVSVGLSVVGGSGSQVEAGHENYTNNFISSSF